MRILVFVCFFLCSTTFCAAQNGRGKIEDFAWLAGCWEFRDEIKNRMTAEQWMKPAGQMMLGASRTVRNGKTVEYEFVRIEERPDGVFYIARPSQNAIDTQFKLIKNEKMSVAFENPAHDFPQRIIYRREGEKLTARIDGNKNGKVSSVDFPMQRAKCE
ncbi:MAG: DUF6265 family protein [Pyrinomonadaceae bacterium]